MLDGGSTSSDGTIRMVDLATTISLIRGLPAPRHAEGAFIAKMFRTVPPTRWVRHAHDLLIQKWCVARTILAVEQLDEDRLRPLADLEQDALARADTAPNKAAQTRKWLEAANEVQKVTDDAKAAAVRRYALRNFGVTFVVAGLLVVMVFWVLHTVTFADPWYILRYRAYAKEAGQTFWSLPDVVAMAWAFGVVFCYYLLTVTVYLALMGSAGYSHFDASVNHDTFSQRRYLISAVGPGMIAQWAFSRVFTIYYKRPDDYGSGNSLLKKSGNMTAAARKKAAKAAARRQTRLVRFLRAVVRTRLLFSPSVQSSSIGKVYLIRLYMAFFTALALAVLLLVESFHTFPLPYMFQGASLKIDTVSWAARFQANTLKIMTVPLLLGNVLNLMMWAGAKLDMVEIETLFALKKAKERRLFGVVVEEEEEDPGHAVEATLRQIDRAHEQGEYTSEQAEELESLLLQTRAEKELFDTQIVDLKAKIERQQGERADTAAAVKSSAAFLGRGFHDIEMLLEAGFTELESKRELFMGTGRKAAQQKKAAAKARQDRRMGRTQLGAVAEDEELNDDEAAAAGGGGGGGGGGLPGGPLVDGGVFGADADDDEGAGDDDESEGSDVSEDDLSSLASEDLAAMDFDELQARLAQNEARELRMIKKATKGDGGRWGGIGADGDDGVTDETRAHEREAAEVRRVEFMSVAQSKEGKRAQIGELSARVDAEKEEAAALHSRLELAVVDEQAILKKWQRLDEELQEAEVEKAAALATKNKEKEAALGRAQLAEASLEELKEGYRELRRKEEKVLREVEQAELDGQRELAELKEGHAALGRQKEMWSERLAAADEDRAALFGETQRVELEVRREKAKKAELQESAQHYRGLLKRVL